MKLFRTLSIQEKALKILLNIFGNVNPAARSTVVVLLTEVIQTISSLFIFFIFLRKDFARTKSNKDT